MAVSNQTPRNVSVATAGATVFPYDFKVVDASDLLVTVDGVAKTLNVDYTVDGVGLDAGGNVTFLAALAGGETVMRKRNMAFVRTTDFQSLGDLRSSTLNNDQDAAVLMAQQIAEQQDRALTIPPESTANGTLPMPAALKPLVWNADGTAIENGDTTLTGDLLLRSNLASATGGKGASLVAVQDADGNFAASNVEAALAELAGKKGLGVNSVQAVLRRMADGETIKVVCIGDSITYGQLDAGGVAATPYPARLQALLREFYGNSNITVVNKGVAGSTVQDMLDRFATDVTAEAPDLIVFNGGQNDSRPPAAISVDEYASDVETYLNRCRPRPVIVLGVSPRAFENLGSNVVHFYRRTLAKIAQDRGLPYVDANARFQALYKARAYGRGRLSSDGAHLSLEGYRLLGDVVFCDAFTNDDLYIRPGQFKDVSGQWLFGKTGAYLLAGTNHQDAKSLTMGTDANGGSAKLYLFLDDWDECDLVLHATINCNTTGQQVKVTNISTGGQVTLALSPKLAGGVGWYALDYPIAALRLRPGLNNISLDSVSLSQWAVNGFSVLKRRSVLDRGGYLASYNEASDQNQLADFFGAGYGHGGVNGFDQLRAGPVHLSSGTKIAPICMLGDVNNDTAAPRWRWRATAYPGDVFHFGQQSTNGVDYMPVYSLTLDGTNAVVKCRDATNTQRTCATVALAVLTTGTEVKIDLNSTNTGWGLYVNDTLIYVETVPLSVGLLLGQSAASYPLLVNPPLLRLNGSAYNDVIRGETWRTYSDDKLHTITGAATEKVLTFA